MILTPENLDLHNRAGSIRRGDITMAQFLLMETGRYANEPKSSNGDSVHPAAAGSMDQLPGKSNKEAE